MNQPENTITINNLIKKYNFTHGAELGVRRGEFTTFLCQDNPNLNMICVDLWGEDSSIIESHEHSSNYDTAIQNFEKYKNRITILRQLTTQAYESVDDNSLDFIFMDATHTAEALSLDIKLWLPKLKINGILCGHDYHPHWDNGKLKEYIDNTFKTKITDEYTCWFVYKKDI